MSAFVKKLDRYTKITSAAIQLCGGRKISEMNPDYIGHEKLREIDLVIYLLILIHCNGGERKFFGSPATLGKMINRDADTIRRSMKRLSNARFIIKEGYRIADRDLNKGCTVLSVSEGRNLIASGKGLSFSTRTYKVVSPQTLEKVIDPKLWSKLENSGGQRSDADFLNTPEELLSTADRPRRKNAQSPYGSPAVRGNLTATNRIGKRLVLRNRREKEIH